MASYLIWRIFDVSTVCIPCHHLLLCPRAAICQSATPLPPAEKKRGRREEGKKGRREEEKRKGGVSIVLITSREKIKTVKIKTGPY